jgi:hypothetical protein
MTSPYIPFQNADGFDLDANRRLVDLLSGHTELDKFFDDFPEFEADGQLPTCKALHRTGSADIFD